jgi:steroid delta-isomerase-like uncharacterized protein
MATTQEQNKALVLQLYSEAWNRGNLDFIKQAVSHDFIDHPPQRPFSVPIRGPEALSEAVAAFRKAIPDYHDAPIQVIAENDRVVYLGRITGTHTNNFFQFPAKGGKIDFTSINFYRLQDGLIVEQWNIFGVMDMMQQMGLMPAPGAGAH